MLKDSAIVEFHNPRSSINLTHEERLERGEILVFDRAPFPLPSGLDRDFLLEQQLGPLGHKNISCDPFAGKLGGHIRRGPAQEERLRSILLSFSSTVTDWLPAFLPHYASGIDADRVSYRPLEEATRRSRPRARNDLLHIDAFPNRPSRGRRLLRVFANINPTEPRIWVTSETFARVLARYRADLDRLSPGRGWLWELGANVLGVLRARETRLSDYDRFMVRLHDFLKANEEFQEKAPKKLWSFSAGSVWLAMTDGCTYAELRGRYALEHSFFIHQGVLASPNQSPAALFAPSRAAPPQARAA